MVPDSVNLGGWHFLRLSLVLFILIFLDWNRAEMIVNKCLLCEQVTQWEVRPLQVPERQPTRLPASLLHAQAAQPARAGPLGGHSGLMPAGQELVGCYRQPSSFFPS